jgi:hypothetical protein
VYPNESVTLRLLLPAPVSTTLPMTGTTTPPAWWLTSPYVLLLVPADTNSCSSSPPLATSSVYLSMPGRMVEAGTLQLSA